MKRQGVLIYDAETDRMDIRFGLLDYYGGLHCGDEFDLKIDDEWIATRIERCSFWYLRGIRIANLNGLIVRI